MKLFGTSGIRGVYEEKITTELAFSLGKAIVGLGYKNVVIARDTRESGEELKKHLFAGLKSCRVTDFGCVPTPVLSYGARKLGADCGIMITASHNPADYNGFKFCNSEGRAFNAEEEARVEEALEKEIEKHQDESDSHLKFHDIGADYSEEIKKRFNLKPGLKVLIDPAHGAAYDISPALLKSFGYDVVSINHEADGTFPSRSPEPSHKNLAKTAELVKKHNCDIGFCHDGDADRVMAVDEKGNVVNFDKFLAFLCKKAAEETGNKTVVTTVDASMIVEEYLKDHGIKAVMSRVGDVFVANDVEKHKACFGGEPSGSYIFPEFGLWPDGIYAIFKTLKFLEQEKRKLSEILAEIPEYPFSREKLSCANEKKEQVMNAITKIAPDNCDISDVDGLRFGFQDSIVLIRSSGTEPYIRINVEARDKEKLKKLEKEWHNKLKEIINQKTKEKGY